MPPDIPGRYLRYTECTLLFIIINRLGWWLWTSVCGMLNSPQAVRIQTSSGPITPWLLPSPAFIAFCLLLFVIFLSFSYLTIHSWLLSVHAHTNICQHYKSLTSREFFIFYYLERVQRYKAKLCMPCKGSFACCSRNKLLAWECSILTSTHCCISLISNNKTKVVMGKYNNTITNRN